MSIDPFSYSFVLFEWSAKLWPFRKNAVEVSEQHQSFHRGISPPPWHHRQESARFAPDEARPLLAFAGVSVQNTGSAMTGQRTIQTANARCAITLIRWAR
jgi:hypothetical protein